MLGILEKVAILHLIVVRSNKVKAMKVANYLGPAPNLIKISQLLSKHSILSKMSMNDSKFDVDSKFSKEQKAIQ